MSVRTISSEEADKLGREGKWKLLSPYLKQHGSACMSYSTLQPGMSYYLDEERGYISYYPLKSGFFAPGERRFMLGDPVTAVKDYQPILKSFLKAGGSAIFYQISRDFASVLSKDFSFKVNELGLEWDIDAQSFELKGKSKAQLRQWINKAQREGVEIFEEGIESMEQDAVRSLSDEWLKRKGGEAKAITRPLVFANEEGVRFFWAKREGRLIGMTVFDPLYSGGRAKGYYHNISRAADDAPHGTTDLMTVKALEKFKAEKIEVLSLGMSPFCELEDKDFPSRILARQLFRWMFKHCPNIYPAQGNYFHKSRYDGTKRKIYVANAGSNQLIDLFAAVKGLGLFH